MSLKCFGDHFGRKTILITFNQHNLMGLAAGPQNDTQIFIAKKSGFLKESLLAI